MLVSVEQPPETPSRYAFKASVYSSHSALLGHLPAPGAERAVLDVGCGPGHLSRILAARGYSVTGIETARSIDFPQDVHLIEADLDRGLPAFNALFDTIVCADVLEHLRLPGSLLRELQNVIGPRGRLLASLPNSGHAYFRWNVLMGRFPKQEKGLFDRTHLHFFTWQGWLDLFAEAGWRIESVQPTGVPVDLALPSLQGTALARWLERLSFDLARIRKTLFAYQFVVTARPA